MKALPVHGSAFFCPLVSRMDQRPLPAEAAEMPNAGGLELVGFPVPQCILVQVTPSGAGSTCTL